MGKLLRTKVGAFLLTSCIVTTSFLAMPASLVQVDAKTTYVYVAASGNGEKYHTSKNCSRMRGNVRKLKISDAKNAAYGPCKKCYR